MSKVLKIVLMVCAIVLVLAVSGSMIYYYAFFRPRNERAEWEAELEFEKEKQEAELKKEAEEFAKEEAQKRKEELEELHTQEALAKCLDGVEAKYLENLDKAYEEYIEDWNLNCKEFGLSPNSSLPLDLAERIEGAYKNELERIDKLYENAKSDCFDFFD